MKTLRIPRTDLLVSELGLGTWGLGGPMEVGSVALGWPPIPPRRAERLLRQAVEVGINFIDTSDMYGRGAAETLIGKVLGQAANVVIATKGGLLPEFVPGTETLRRRFDATYLTTAVELSLRRLERETVDLYQLHGADGEIIRSGEVAQLIEALRRQGKIRYAGVSLRGESLRRDYVDACIATEWVATVQLTYNVLQPEATVDVERLCQTGKTVIVRSALAHGFLVTNKVDPSQFGHEDHRARKFTASTLAAVASMRHDILHEIGVKSLAGVFLSWARAREGPRLVLVGARRANHLSEAVRTFEGPPLSEVQRQLVSQIVSRHFSA